MLRSPALAVYAFGVKTKAAQAQVSLAMTDNATALHKLLAGAVLDLECVGVYHIVKQDARPHICCQADAVTVVH